MYAFRGALIGNLLKEALSTSLLTIEDVFLTGKLLTKDGRVMLTKYKPIYFPFQVL